MGSFWLAAFAAWLNFSLRWLLGCLARFLAACTQPLLDRAPSKLRCVADASVQAASPAGAAEQREALTLQDLAAMPGLGALIMADVPLPDRVRLRGLCRAFASSVDASLQAVERICGDDLLGLDECGRSNGDVLRWLASKCPNLLVLERPEFDKQPWWKLPIADVAVTHLAAQCRQLHTLKVPWCKGVGDTALRAVAANCSQLRHLDIGGCKLVTCDGVSAIAAGCRQLEHLDLFSVKRVTDGSALALAAHCPRLQYLNVYGTKVGSAGIIAIARACPGLRTLNVSYCEAVDDGGIAAVAENCPLLECLEYEGCEVGNQGMAPILRNCLQIKDICFEEYVTGDAVRLGPNSCRELRTLRISLDSWTDDSIAAMAARCSKLTSLSIYNLDVTGAGVAVFAASCPWLEELSLPYRSELTDAGMLAVAKNCPRLRSVSLGQCKFVTDASLVELARRCPSLQELRFYHAFAGNRTAIALARNCPDLRSFGPSFFHSSELPSRGTQDLRQAWERVRVKDHGLAMVLRWCLQLKTLNLSMCRGFTDAGISMAGDSCKRLQRLVLSGCRGCFTARGLAAMASHLGALVSLDAGECDAVTDVSVVALANHCPRLRFVVMSSCNVGDEGVAALARHCALVSLRVMHCNGVTDASLLAIGEHCGQLGELRVAGCKGVTVPAAMALLPKCKGLSVVDILCSPQIPEPIFQDIKRTCPRMRCLTGLTSYTSVSDEDSEEDE
eukprot:jgi/Mesvir1/5457/Mv15512-RA.1